MVEKEKTFSYAELALDTSISFEGLDVTSTKINDNGEVTLTCEQGNNKIKVFLGALKDADGNPITEKTYAGETINVKGLVDKYYENYQVRVTSASDITVVE